ncbi:MAG: DOPA 4,5-dioxygenase family protein [Paracoccaceae bacterium]
MTNPTAIKGWHAHIYFDADTVDQARKLADDAEAAFDVEKGRVYEREVGPHPMWSCQLAFGPDVFAKLAPWLALNRGDLIIFVHPDTGDHLADHRDHALWFGGYLQLKLDAFS